MVEQLLATLVHMWRSMQSKMLFNQKKCEPAALARTLHFGMPWLL